MNTKKSLFSCTFTELDTESHRGQLLPEFYFNFLLKNAYKWNHISTSTGNYYMKGAHDLSLFVK